MKLKATSARRVASSSSVQLLTGVALCVVFLIGFQMKPPFRDENHIRKTSSDIVSTTANNHHLTGLDFWWITNLKDTPISLSQETREFVFHNHNTDSRSLAETTTTQKIERVWIDVGVNKGSDFIVNLKESKNQDLFLIGFEPSTIYKPCTHERCAVFWAACTPKLDIVQLNVLEGADLCDSILPPNSETTSKLWRGCVTPVTDKSTGESITIQVPGLPLHETVSRIPNNIIVEYIKIDAQGYDLEVMRGVYEAIDRVEVVSLEGMDVTDKSKLLYVGQPTLNEIKEELSRNGWIFVKTVNNDGVKGEVNAFFVSKEEFRHKVDYLADVLMSNKEGGDN